MTKITFKNDAQPALNATNLNQLQTNIENALKNVESPISTIGITWSSGITAQSTQENTIKINKIEKSATLIFGVVSSSTKETAFKLGSFNSQYAPAKLVFATAIVSTNTGTMGCQASIDTDGSININNVGQPSTIFRGQIKWYY